MRPKQQAFARASHTHPEGEHSAAVIGAPPTLNVVQSLVPATLHVAHARTRVIDVLVYLAHNRLAGAPADGARSLCSNLVRRDGDVTEAVCDQQARICAQGHACRAAGSAVVDSDVGRDVALEWLRIGQCGDEGSCRTRTVADVLVAASDEAVAESKAQVVAGIRRRRQHKESAGGQLRVHQQRSGEIARVAHALKEGLLHIIHPQIAQAKCRLTHRVQQLAAPQRRAAVTGLTVGDGHFASFGGARAQDGQDGDTRAHRARRPSRAHALQYLSKAHIVGERIRLRGIGSRVLAGDVPQKILAQDGQLRGMSVIDS